MLYNIQFNMDVIQQMLYMLYKICFITFVITFRMVI